MTLALILGFAVARADEPAWGASDPKWISAFADELGQSTIRSDHYFSKDSLRGECTWFVASVCGFDIPVNRSGGNDAFTWFQRCKEANYKVGSTPRPLSIMVLGKEAVANTGHVAFVTEVRPDGSMIVWDSNWSANLDHKVRRRVVKAKPKGVIGYIYSPPTDRRETVLGTWHNPASSFDIDIMVLMPGGKLKHYAGGDTFGEAIGRWSLAWDSLETRYTGDSTRQESYKYTPAREGDEESLIAGDSGYIKAAPNSTTIWGIDPKLGSIRPIEVMQFRVENKFGEVQRSSFVAVRGAQPGRPWTVLKSAAPGTADGTPDEFDNAYVVKADTTGTLILSSSWNQGGSGWVVHIFTIADSPSETRARHGVRLVGNPAGTPQLYSGIRPDGTGALVTCEALADGVSRSSPSRWMVRGFTVEAGLLKEAFRRTTKERFSEDEPGRDFSIEAARSNVPNGWSVAKLASLKKK